MADGIFKNIGSAFNRYVGGLLGEDVESMTPEERRRARMAAIGAIGRAMSNPDIGTAPIEAVRAGRAAERKAQEEKTRAAAAEALIPQITGRLFGGGTPYTQSQIENIPGLRGVNYATTPMPGDPKAALRMMIETQAGRDVAAGIPDLFRLTQESLTGRIVGGSIQNPLTGEFTAPQPRTGKMLSPQEVAQMRLPVGTVVYQEPGGEPKILYKPEIPGAPKDASGGEKPDDLRKEWNNLTGDYRKIGSAWAKVRDAGANPSAANDIALIFGYMKMLDPTSVVREGEFATAQNAGNIPTRIWALYNQMLDSGQRLTDAQRQDFLRSAYGVIKSQVPMIDSLKNQYTEIARGSKIDPRRVIVDPLSGALLPKITGDNDPNFERIPVGGLFEAPDGSIQRKVR
jgi:hypothetical protein